MTRVTLAAMVTAATTLWLVPAQADMLDDCVRSPDRQRQIDGCTAAIGSGQLSDRNLARVYHYRGLAHFSLGQYERAIEDYGKTLRLDPGSATAYSDRGLAYFALGKYQRAIDDYDEAIRLDPGYGGTYQGRARAYCRLGDTAAALADWEQSFALQGESVVRVAQEVLTDEGFYDGPIDGVFGPTTQAAVLAQSGCE